MIELSIEHILLFVIIAFLLYHFVGSCECTKEGFSIGIKRPIIPYPSDWNTSNQYCSKLFAGQKINCNLNSKDPNKYCIGNC